MKTFALVLLCAAAPPLAASAQGLAPATPDAPAPAPLATVQTPRNAPTPSLAPSATPSDANAAPLITLDEAIRRAEANEPTLAAARATSISARLDRSIAIATLLPQVTYHNQYLYTQPNGLNNAAGQIGSQAAPRFIANNAIREYASQALITETLAPDAGAQVARAQAAAAQAAAELEITQRGVVATVVGQYFGLLAANQKYATAQRAQEEAARFVSLTQKLENGREVAHADVVKAQLQLQQRQRDLEDALVLRNKAQLDLGVLLFPDPRTYYRLAPESETAPPLPGRADIDAAAMRNNPELRSALSSIQAAEQEVSIARLAYLPDLILNVTYGIDAPQFAVNGPVDVAADGTIIGRPRNLGYSAFVTFDVPVWNWLATRDRIRQADVRRAAAKTTLNYTQRRLVAQLEELYDEASVADRQLQSLETSVRTAAESLRLTNLRYQAGEGTALEVVDAQNQLILAENAHADGMVRYRTALANLQTLTGVLP